MPLIPENIYTSVYATEDRAGVSPQSQPTTPFQRPSEMALGTPLGTAARGDEHVEHAHHPRRFSFLEIAGSMRPSFIPGGAVPVSHGWPEHHDHTHPSGTTIDAISTAAAAEKRKMSPPLNVLPTTHVPGSSLTKTAGDGQQNHPWQGTGDVDQSSFTRLRGTPATQPPPLAPLAPHLPMHDDVVEIGGGSAGNCDSPLGDSGTGVPPAMRGSFRSWNVWRS